MEKDLSRFTLGVYSNHLKVLIDYYNYGLPRLLSRGNKISY